VMGVKMDWPGRFPVSHGSTHLVLQPPRFIFLERKSTTMARRGNANQLLLAREWGAEPYPELSQSSAKLKATSSRSPRPDGLFSVPLKSQTTGRQGWAYWTGLQRVPRGEHKESVPVGGADGSWSSLLSGGRREQNVHMVDASADHSGGEGSSRARRHEGRHLPVTLRGQRADAESTARGLGQLPIHINPRSEVCLLMVVAKVYSYQ
jgi:hypothetical protein